MSSLNDINRTKYILFSAIETNDLLTDNAPLIFTYGKDHEKHWALVILFTLLQLPVFATIHGEVYQQ